MTTPVSTETPVKDSVFRRLYTGTGAFDFVGLRRRWFLIFGVLLLISALTIGFRGFTFGIDFEGGTKLAVPVTNAQPAEVEKVFADAVGFAPEKTIVAGTGDGRTVELQSRTLEPDQIEIAKRALHESFRGDGDRVTDTDAITDSTISEVWGGEITKRALLSLVAFLLLVGIYIAIRFEKDMAFAAIAALGCDLVITAGIYAIVGFEVTPATVIGLLTILGFSLYDTVVVFDKVDENTHGFEHDVMHTYAERANLAINQTLMRSINTTVFSALPIISLFVIAVWLLGVGTLKDLALVQLIGVIIGTFSSVFLATPLLMVFRERNRKIREHTRRVLELRAAG